MEFFKIRKNSDKIVLYRVSGKARKIITPKLIKALASYQNGDVVLIRDEEVLPAFSKAFGHEQIFVTSKCNNNCIMCPQETFENDFKLEDHINLINLLDPATEHVTLTGGEPTYNSREFLTLMQAIRKRLKKANIEVLTNGVALADESLVEKIFRITPCDVFWDIPLYASNSILHNRIVGSNTFFHTLKAMYNLRVRGYPVEVRFVIMKPNLAELEPLAEFIYYNVPFVSHVAFMGMEMMHNAAFNNQELHVDPIDFVQSLNNAVEYLDTRRINASIYNIPLCFLPRSLWGFARKSISIWKRYYYQECVDCKERENCGGVFESNKTLDKKHISIIDDVGGSK